MLITLPEVVAWWGLLFVALLPGLRRAIARQFDAVQVLVFFTAGMVLVYGVTFYNIGLAYRQRSQVLPWLVMFGMVGLEQRMLGNRPAHVARRLRMAAAPGGIKGGPARAR
jgi:hypothetical protein